MGCKMDGELGGAMSKCPRIIRVETVEFNGHGYTGVPGVGYSALLNEQMAMYEIDAEAARVEIRKRFQRTHREWPVCPISGEAFAFFSFPYVKTDFPKPERHFIEAELICQTCKPDWTLKDVSVVAKPTDPATVWAPRIAVDQPEPPKLVVESKFNVGDFVRLECCKTHRGQLGRIDKIETSAYFKVERQDGCFDILLVDWLRPAIPRKGEWWRCVAMPLGAAAVKCPGGLDTRFVRIAEPFLMTDDVLGDEWKAYLDEGNRFAPVNLGRGG